MSLAVPLIAFLDALGQFLQPSTLAEVILNGLSKAALYAMIAGGLTLIFGLMGVLNFAHGSLTMFGAYLGGLVLVLAVGQATGPLARVAYFFVAVVVIFGALNLAIGQLTGDTAEGLFGLLSLSAAEVSYYMVGAVALLAYLAMQRILHSPFGRVMIAVRENEARARAVGYDTFRYKLAAFAVSGFFAGVAGALFAGFRRSVAPDNSLFFPVSGDALLAAIIGGFGTLAGPIYGRLFDETVREFLSKEGAGGGLLPYLRGRLSEGTLATELFNGLTVREAIATFLNGHASLYLGLLFVAFVLFVPRGLLGTLRDRVGDTLAAAVAKRLR